MVTKMNSFYRTEKSKDSASSGTSGSGTGGAGSGTTGTIHDHTNKAVLDDLGADQNQRLTLKGDLLDAPLRKEDW
jgi:hypothetical protein